MIDLDNFKTINDTYGHLIGDMLLTKTASKIKKHIRKTDIACRYGGDEFLIYLPGANASVAHSIADGVRRDILEDFSYSEEGTEIRHTISIGVTENRVDDTFDGLFLRADAALYQAKRTGRNKISIL
jgi:diguanylate cyclase (GGDEF)-like protein